MNTEYLIKHRLLVNENDFYLIVPNKLPKAIDYMDEKTLLSIHDDKLVAKELILYFASFLTPTLFHDHFDRLHLHSDMLTKRLAPAKYYNVINACLRGTPQKGPFIERDSKYYPGSHSKSCKFTPHYSNCPACKYKIKSRILKDIYIRNLLNQIKETADNPIVANLLQFYGKVGLELPKREFLLAEGKRLSEIGFHTKKGKRLLMRNRNPLSRFAKKYNTEAVSFVEDNIRLYEILTSSGLRMPSIQSIDSGNRVTDSFTLMPSWIRSQVRLDGEPLTEVDFGALHPNIVMCLYNGKGKTICHRQVAEALCVKSEDFSSFKAHHLAYFNKHPGDMPNSAFGIHEYYSVNEPDLLQKIVFDKNRNGHCYTSRIMFRKEVQIMTDCITTLNSKGIFVLYVYDALLCEAAHRDEVQKVMNSVASAHGVFAPAKFSKGSHDSAKASI